MQVHIVDEVAEGLPGGLCTLVALPMNQQMPVGMIAAKDGMNLTGSLQSCAAALDRCRLLQQQGATLAPKLGVV